MYSVQLERDLQDIADLSGALERGTLIDSKELEQRLIFVCAKVSAWQWCIHGESLEFRKQVIRWLVSKGKYVLARRYALCGKGDLLLKHEKDGRARVKPMGCGARFCPRCSRRAGRKHLTRIASHLSSSPHGSIWHMVLTQPVFPKESIQGARARFEKSWTAFYPTLRKSGMTAALATYHLKPSVKYGWHYHCHLVLELDDIVDGDSWFEKVNEAWHRAIAKSAPEQRVFHDIFVRLVTKPGPAMVGMKDNTQLEFWNESSDAVETALHYVIRDVLQGIESWIGAMTRKEDCFDFCDFMGSAKRHRSYGTWRKKVDVETEERDEAEESGSAGVSEAAKMKGVSEWVHVSTMDHCLHESKSGPSASRDLLTQLLGCTNRSTGVLYRLRKLVSSIAA